MFSIRDSVEPEDSFEENDIFPSSAPVPPPQESPITFDLPSTTSVATQPSSTSIQTQKTKTPSAKSTKRRRTVDDEGLVNSNSKEDEWEFPTELPARKPGRPKKVVEPRNTINILEGAEESEASVKSNRRKSMSTVNEKSGRRNTRVNSVPADVSPPQTHKKRKLSKRIEESDTERIDTSDEPDTNGEEDFIINTTTTTSKILSSTTEIQIDEIIDAEPTPSPRRKSTLVAVEIPPKGKQRGKIPLEEIVVENIPTPETSPVKIVDRQVTPEPLEAQELEGAVVARGTETSKRGEEKKGVAMSPVKVMNIASILAKSPNRPMYRVGLSKRVNIEPLHGYLKKKPT